MAKEVLEFNLKKMSKATLVIELTILIRRVQHLIDEIGFKVKYPKDKEFEKEYKIIEDKL